MKVGRHHSQPDRLGDDYMDMSTAGKIRKDLVTAIMGNGNNRHFFSMASLAAPVLATDKPFPFGSGPFREHGKDQPFIQDFSGMVQCPLITDPSLDREPSQLTKKPTQNWILNSSALPIKNNGRGKASCMGNTSKFERWFEAKTTAPLPGKFSNPSTCICMNALSDRPNHCYRDLSQHGFVKYISGDHRGRSRSFLISFFINISGTLQNTILILPNRTSSYMHEGKISYTLLVLSCAIILIQGEK